MRPHSPIWLLNALVYRDPSLFQARTEGDPRVDRTGGSYLRAERQCLMRLPKTRAVVFSIHTYVVHVDDLDPAAREGLAEARL